MKNMKPTTQRRGRKKNSSHLVRVPRLELLEDRCLLAVSPVADINQISAGGDPSWITAVGDTAFFTAYDSTRGIELWKTSGTVSSTKFVKDIYPGTTSGSPNSSEPLTLTNVNGRLFFSAYHPEHGRELWKSNGTGAGTVLVKDIMQGSAGSEPFSLTKSNGLLYFGAFDDPTSGSQLWKSDGTPSGTTILTQTNLGSSPSHLTDVDGTLYFVGAAGPGIQALYRITGGTPTAVPIPLSGSYFIGELENVNGVLYFVTSSSEGHILWRTNGTITTQIASTPVGFENRILFLTNVNGTLYGTVGGSRLYKYDAGKVTLLATIDPGKIEPLVVVGNKVFFTADDGMHGQQLWVSNGTRAGTKLVKVIGSGIGTQFPLDLTNVNGVLYFSADDGVNGRELWKSDGTARGTKMVEDLNAGGESSNPRFITNFKGVALFQATENDKGSQLYRSNGTIAGTFRISNINPLSVPSNIADANGVAYLFGDDGSLRRESWSSRRRVTGDTVTAIDSVLADNEPDLLSGSPGFDLYFSSLGNAIIDSSKTRRK
jgi:ELWxxDGT repeat protein